jgi:hypothetical protein
MIPLRDRIIENGPKVVRVPGKLNVCVKKTFPIIGIFSLLFGSAFLGFSFVTVHEGQIGYYAKKDCSVNETTSCTIKSFQPGLYFEMPWKKGHLKIANVSPSSITFGIDNKIYKVDYEISDIKLYLKALVSFKTESDLEAAVKDEIIKFITPIKLNITSTYNISIEIYGMSFSTIKIL